jgi:nitroimidazol reductase NimA-like FMN-containing flavoprotein (pyridoxamine 5'-phosphate oxidase superfamily)
MTSRGLLVLDEDECTELLKRGRLGRIGIKLADDLMIAPVFYAYINNSIVFRTDPGTKLDAAVLQAAVAFEVDDADEGWSVLVRGHAHEVQDLIDEAELRERLGNTWSPHERARVVRIKIERLTGRRLGR